MNSRDNRTVASQGCYKALTPPSRNQESNIAIIENPWTLKNPGLHF